jgi:amphi-Trp domain-containing protein
MSDDLLKIKEKERVTREEAAARLRAIADELSSGNDVIFERDGMRVVAKVPDEVELEIEFEVGEDETELEIELSWGGLSG